MAQHPEFDPETVPWLDRCYFEIDSYVSSLPAANRPDYDLRERLVHWMRHGYVAFEGLVEAELIDDYLADVERVWEQRSTLGVKFQIDGYGEARARDFPPEAWRVRRFRIMDLHNASTAGKQLSLHPRIVEFLRHVFRQTPVAMQTLTFIYGSQQGAHQDFPYVTARIPSNLAATWIALEDVDPRAGPLFYHPGSHTVEKFDWGDKELAFTEKSTRTVPDFIDHLGQQVAARGYRPELFCPKKGDVFFWHSALVHGGSSAEDPHLTRRSFVTHYSTSSGYPRDRRAPEEVPLVYAINGGLMFADPTNPDDEDRFNSRPLPDDSWVGQRALEIDSMNIPPMRRSPTRVPEEASLRNIATRTHKADEVVATARRVVRRVRRGAVRLKSKW